MHAATNSHAPVLTEHQAGQLGGLASFYANRFEAENLETFSAEHQAGFRAGWVLGEEWHALGLNCAQALERLQVQQEVDAAGIVRDAAQKDPNVKNPKSPFYSAALRVRSESNRAFLLVWHKQTDLLKRQERELINREIQAAASASAQVAA